MKYSRGSTSQQSPRSGRRRTPKADIPHLGGDETVFGPYRGEQRQADLGPRELFLENDMQVDGKKMNFHSMSKEELAKLLIRIRHELICAEDPDVCLTLCDMLNVIPKGPGSNEFETDHFLEGE